MRLSLLLKRAGLRHTDQNPGPLLEAAWPWSWCFITAIENTDFLLWLLHRFQNAIALEFDDSEWTFSVEIWYGVVQQGPVRVLRREPAQQGRVSFTFSPRDSGAAGLGRTHL